MEEKNVFIIGSNGIPANYGGFEPFVENLTHKKISKNINTKVSTILLIATHDIFDRYASCVSIPASI